MSNMDKQKLIDEILAMKRDRGAILLAHNYQIPEIQDIADFLGDSLELARKAAETDAEVIVFCGVHFMAETAKLLSPERTVLIPDISAGCPMADMVSPGKLRDFKKLHPGVPVVAYVNTTAATKAEADICCTSANAIDVVNSLESDEAIFVPDCNLGSWVQEHTDKKLLLWQGYCPTHHQIPIEDILQAKAQHPNAKLIVHGECTPEVRALADEVLSTGGMVRYAQQTDAREIIVGTEHGMVHRLQKDNPQITFYAIRAALCPNMKKTTLPKLHAALSKMQFRVEIDKALANRARASVERMLAVK